MAAPSDEQRRRPQWVYALFLAGLLAVFAVITLLIGGPSTPALWGLVSGVLLSLVVAVRDAITSRR